MKKTFLIIAILSQLLIVGQEIKITYAKITYSKVLENPDTRIFDATLYIKGNESLFLWKTDDGPPKRLDDGTIMYYSNNKLKGSYFMYNKISKDVFYTRLFLDNKECLIKQKASEIKPKWVLINEFKKIDNFKCQKAEAVIKGFRHTVWFTHDIPIPFGPNKYYFGLNGLVLEGYDENNILSFFVKKIVINDQSIINEVDRSFNTLDANFNKTITPEEYDRKNDESTLELERRINARRKKGMPMIKFRKDCDDCSKKIKKKNNN